MRLRHAAIRLALAATLSATSASDAFALSGFGAPWAPRRLAPNGVQGFRAASFGRTGTNGMALLSERLNAAAIDVDHAVAAIVRERLTLPGIALVRDPGQRLGLTQQMGAQSASYHLSFAGIPVCDAEIRAHHGGDGSFLTLGALPVASAAISPAAGEWTDLEATGEELRQALEERGDDADDFRLGRAERCWQALDDVLVPAWRARFTAGGMPYEGIGDATHAFRLGQRFFSVNGTAKIFENNSLDEAVASAQLKDLVGDGTLTGTRLRVYLEDDADRALSADHKFDYATTDARFVQPSLYYYVQKQLDFMTALGYVWPPGKTLPIAPHYRDANNAFYSLDGVIDSDLGTINVGDGDGSVLANLATDQDVSSHEFSHQVVYQTLKTVDRCYETLAVHEALADFFTFARTGNACLGETICPAGSRACQVVGCLRSGDNVMKYGDATWMKLSGDESCYTHPNGQLFSGLLWDLQKAGVMTVGEVAQMTYRAVTLFQPSSGFRDLLLSLFYAEQELFSGTKRAILRAAVEARGLGAFLADVPAEGGALPALDGDGAKSKTKVKPSNVETQPTTGSSTSSIVREKAHDEKAKDSCGAVGAQGGGKLVHAILLLLLATPVVLAAFAPQAKRVVARMRRRKSPR